MLKNFVTIILLTAIVCLDTSVQNEVAQDNTKIFDKDSNQEKFKVSDHISASNTNFEPVNEKIESTVNQATKDTKSAPIKKGKPTKKQVKDHQKKLNSTNERLISQNKGLIRAEEQTRNNESNQDENQVLNYNKLLDKEKEAQRIANVKTQGQVENSVSEDTNQKIDNMFPESMLQDQSEPEYQDLGKRLNGYASIYTKRSVKYFNKVYQMNKQLAMIRARLIKARISKNKNLIALLSAHRLKIYLSISDKTYLQDVADLHKILITQKIKQLDRTYYSDCLKKCNKDIADNSKNVIIGKKSINDAKKSISELNNKLDNLDNQVDNSVVEAAINSKLQDENTKIDNLTFSMLASNKRAKKCKSLILDYTPRIAFYGDSLKKQQEIVKLSKNVVVSQKMAKLKFANLINIKRTIAVQLAFIDIYLKRSIRYENDYVLLDNKLKHKVIKKLAHNTDPNIWANENDYSTQFKDDVQYLLGQKESVSNKDHKQFFWTGKDNGVKTDTENFLRNFAKTVRSVPHPFTKLLIEYKKDIDKVVLASILQLYNLIYENYKSLQFKQKQVIVYRDQFETINENVSKNQLEASQHKYAATLKLIEFVKYEKYPNKGYNSKKAIEKKNKIISKLMVESKKILIRRKMKKMQKRIRFLQIKREASKVKELTNKHLLLIILDRRKAKTDLFKEGIDFLISNQSALEGKIQEIKNKYGDTMVKSIKDNIAVLENQIEFNKKHKQHLQEAEKETVKVFDNEEKVLKGVIEKSKKNMIAYYNQSRALNKKLNKTIAFKVKLPQLMGLQIPEGIICINENTIYLECYYADWQKTGDESRFDCELWGNNRGKCAHLNQAGQPIDTDQLKLSIKTNKICNKNKTECIDYKNYKKTVCPNGARDENDRCTQKLQSKLYNPNTFKNCSIDALQVHCKNDYKSQKRDCMFQTGLFYECKTYKRQKCDKKCRKINEMRIKAGLNKLPKEYEFLYTSFMSHYQGEYNVITSSEGPDKKNNELDLTQDFNESLFEYSTEQVWVD